MDNAQVTQRDIDAWEIYGPKIFNCEMTGPEALARHRLERSEPVGCQYPVHGSVTHVRNVECCDFCGHPADTTPLNPVAEIERLREALSEAHKAIAEYYRYWTGGETRGSYDGKPERNGLWKAMYAARTTLGDAS